MNNTNEKIKHLDEVRKFLSLLFTDPTEAFKSPSEFQITVFNSACSVVGAINLLKEYQATVESLKNELRSLEDKIRELQSGDYTKALQEQKERILASLKANIEELINEW